MKASVIFAAILLGLFLMAESNGADTTQPPTQSLKGKTDDELLHLVIGGRDETQKKVNDELREDMVRSSSLDRLWEMPPRQAALALASEYVEKEIKGRAKFTIDEMPNVKPPPAGEIGIRWISGNYYALPQRGMFLLRYERLHSRLSISDFQVLSRVSKQELEEALSRMDDHDLPVQVAQQTYEILWWLHHARRVGDRAGGTSFRSTDDYGDAFWMKPDGPNFGRVFLGSPNAEDLNDEEFSSFPAFAYTLLCRVIERQGIKPRRPVPTIGQYVEANADATFLRLHPRPEGDDESVVRRWVEQMIAILRKPERFKMYNDVLFAVVPTAEPLRYKSHDIDRALIDLLHGADAAATVHKRAAKDEEDQEKKILDDIAQGKTNMDDEKRRALSKHVVDEKSAARSIRTAAETAGEMLGFRDQTATFSELIERAKRPAQEEDPGFGGSNCLTGAAALAGRHPELRPPLITYLRTQLTDIHKAHVSAQQVFDCVWRADLRGLAADLERVATRSPEENEDGAMVTSPAPPGGNGKFHAARVILMAWREADAMTKIKLDAFINGYVGGSNSIPDFLRAEFDRLSPDEQLVFRNFVTWMRTVEVPWSRECLEDIFTPHTPRPKEEQSLRQFWYD